MKTQCMTASLVSTLAIGSAAYADTVILSDDFSSSSIAANFRLYESDIDTGWKETPQYNTHPEV